MTAHHSPASAFTLDALSAARARPERFAASFVPAARVAAELARRAVRAGAARLEIDSCLITRRLIVRDDAESLCDFAQCFDLTRATWLDAASLLAHPAGLGPTAAMQHSAQLVVRRAGRAVRLDCARARAGAQVTPERDDEAMPCGMRTAFEMTDTDAVLDADSAEAIFRGFALPVTFNGRDLARVDAIGTGGFEPCAAGMLRAAPLVLGGQTLGELYGVRMYLDGLPLRPVTDAGESVLHVDPSVIAPRAPALLRVNDYDLARVRVFVAMHDARHGADDDALAEVQALGVRPSGEPVAA